MGALKKVSDGVAELKRMRVHPRMQGRGIGRRMLGLLEESATELGYTTIQLDTTVNQLAAQRLYESSGYVETRRETEGWPLEMIYYEKQLGDS